MGQSYRIRSEIGINKTINVQIDQEFDFIELLSLKIQQEDIYTRSCADYGVLAGRITANNGFGIPNARVSIFIPIENIDESNPIVTSIYPYKSPTDKNEDGYRYNLLPYEKSYSKHAATGTLPTRLDVLTGKTAIEIYDKYYKFTAKTNESGDYMIMGVPLGNQTVVMDVDLSDIGEFSLTPQDLIRMGLATEAQVAGNKFKMSNDLNSLPQLVSISKNVDVSPLWGDPDICQIAISRVDFDLRDEANIDIQPTAVFMGSIYSAPDKFRVRSNCKPKDNLGNLCDLDAGPGQILALRQTIQQDSDGNPILEQYQLEQSGNIIDGNGVWLTELPMNLQYVITNEFGEKVVSNDPTIGIPTKGKYRFKIKWQQSATLTEQTRRAYFLVPNIREYGWVNSNNDPNYDSDVTISNQLRSSYYFGLDWTGYTNGLQVNEINEKLDEIIDCKDTFYEFNFNKVYTVSGLIDQYKKGAKGRFIGIKEIDDDSCSTTVNKFPVNEGFRNFDLLFFIFSILFQVIQIIGIPVLIIAHLILGIYSIVIGFLCALCKIKIPIINVRPFGFLCNLFNIKCESKDFTIKLSMITYPECEACDCNETSLNSGLVGGGTSGVLSYVSDSGNYYNDMQNVITEKNLVGENQEDIPPLSLLYSQAIAGNSDNPADVGLFKTPKSGIVQIPSTEKNHMANANSLPLGERINVFNSRTNYFGSGMNRITVTFESTANNVFHYDNTITVMANTSFSAGQLVTTVDPATSTDPNFLFSAVTNNGPKQGLPGTTNKTAFNITVESANIGNSTASMPSVQYKLLSGGVIERQLYPMDREYFQVITAITVSDASKIWNVSSGSFPSILESSAELHLRQKSNLSNTYKEPQNDGRIDFFKFKDTFQNFDQQYILILQRGVDPYSPLYTNKYGLGKLFGLPNENSLQITATTRLNIPIQKLNSSTTSVQQFIPNNIFYPSYFFTTSNQFSAFTSSTIGYYGALDASVTQPYLTRRSLFGVTGLGAFNGRLYQSTSTNLAERYDNLDDVSGGSYMWGDWYYNRERYSKIKYVYLTPNLYPSFQTTPMKITNKSNIVMRTDRLPSSDQLNGQSWATNPALLQQNNNFQLYTIPELTGDAATPGYTTGASQVTPDLEDQAFSGTVYGSFSCPGMVSLSCYSGSGFNFGVDEKCRITDPVQLGCYILLKRPVIDLIKDFKTFNEWGYRYRFFYGLCRGVLSQSFMNNWVNGSLFAFPIQANTRFSKKNRTFNQPYSTFCKDLIYFDYTTNNFYYRSSPYNNSTGQFIGKDGPNDTSVNKLNLLFPTTLINLGPKDYFYQEITFDPSNKGYVLDQLNPTTYNDTSDLVNLFVISRIVNSSFIARLASVGNNGLDQLFSRDSTNILNVIAVGAKRIDGDLAQMMSINSEIGNISFSPEFYQFSSGNTSPVYVDTGKDSLIGIYFSSTTENLQFKDYISPGRIDFRGPAPNEQLYPYEYGIKSQVVPFYQWGSGTKSAQTIFGSELSNWQTNGGDIVQGKLYQGLDRLSIETPSYFKGANASISDTFARGYIFEVNAVPTPNATQFTFSLNSGKIPNKFVVGAPFHFYFGLIKGQTSLDKFKTKYSVGE